MDNMKKKKKIMYFSSMAQDTDLFYHRDNEIEQSKIGKQVGG